MGALMGGGVGLTIGFIFGSYSIMRYAPCSSPLPHLRLLYPRSRIHKKGRRRPSRLPCYPLAVHAQQRGNILVLPSHRIGASSFLIPLPPSSLDVTPHFTLLLLHSNGNFRTFTADTLSRLFETTPSCPRILKPRGFSCFLPWYVLVLKEPR